MNDLDSDPWIKENSEIEPKVLHAIATMNYHFNIVQQHIRWLLINMKATSSGRSLTEDENKKIRKMWADDAAKALLAEVKKLPPKHNTTKAQAYFAALLIEVGKAQKS